MEAVQARMGYMRSSGLGLAQDTLIGADNPDHRFGFPRCVVSLHQQDRSSERERAACPHADDGLSNFRNVRIFSVLWR